MRKDVTLLDQINCRLDQILSTKKQFIGRKTSQNQSCTRLCWPFSQTPFFKRFNAFHTASNHNCPSSNENASQTRKISDV